ncbi:MAG: CpsB/CapC family capsule biosynthesis tyrosine phosphatase [Ruminococcus sp.]
MKMADVHCHILPAVDDGAYDLSETREMLKTAYEEGIRTIFATPHYHGEMGSGVWAKRKAMLKETQRIAREVSEDFRILAGSEIFYSEKAVKDLLEGTVWTMNDSCYVLVEFVPYEEFSYIKRGLQTLQYHGFWPILAHVERYEDLMKIERVRQLTDMGIYLQVNAGSVLGKNGRLVKNYIRELLKERMIHLVGTDAHGSRHRRPLMAKCASYIEKKTDRQYCRDICRENARKIIRREYINV